MRIVELQVEYPLEREIEESKIDGIVVACGGRRYSSGTWLIGERAMRDVEYRFLVIEDALFARRKIKRLFSDIEVEVSEFEEEED